LDFALQDSPDPFIAAVWQLLAEAAGSSHAAFHTPAVATVDVSTGQPLPDVRHVVLRRVDVANRTLAFHVDARSPKFHQLQRSPSLKWLFYDPPTRLQVRIAASVTLHHLNDLARSRWEACQPMSRLCYLTPFTPGQPVTLPPTQAGRAQDPNFGFENFAVVETTASDMDCLYLYHQGHRRAHIDYTHTAPAVRWIAP
jgi:hypothetical protein